jgi:hypothetical protein
MVTTVSISLMFPLIYPKPASAEKGGGTDIGRGGNVVVLPDDTVHLADPFIVRPAQDQVHPFSDFNGALRGEIERIGRLMVRLGVAIDESIDEKPWKTRKPTEAEKKQTRYLRYSTRDAQAKFIVSNVEDPLTEYVLVDKFPSSCVPKGDIGPTPDGNAYRVVELACTQGPTTYILKDIFSKLSIREQALSIIHERLHGMRREFPHYLVTDVTQGLGVLLDLSNLQRKGQRPILSESQLKLLKSMLKAFGQTGLNEGAPEEEYEFWQNWAVATGGGIYHQSARISPTAYLGVGAMLGEGGVMDAGSELINATCYLVSCELRDGAKVADAVIAPRIEAAEFEFDSGLFSAVFGRHSVVSGSSRFMPSMSSKTAERVIIGDDAKVNNADLSGFSALKIAQSATLDTVGIVFSPAPMTRSMVRFEVLESASLQNVRAFIVAGEKNTSGDSEYLMSISARRQLDFKGEDVCKDKLQWPQLKRSVLLGSEDELRAQCQQPGA